MWLFCQIRNTTHTDGGWEGFYLLSCLGQHARGVQQPVLAGFEVSDPSSK